MSYSKISKFLFVLCLYAFQQAGMSSSVTVDDPYPLGGVWRTSLPSFCQEVHLHMAREELRVTTEFDRTGKSATNVAFCELNIYSANEEGELTSYEILDVKDKCFLSGGHILPEGTDKFVPIVQDRNLIAEEIKKKKASIAGLLSNLSKLTGDIDSKIISTSAASALLMPTHPILARLSQTQQSCAQLMEEYEALKARASLINELEIAYESESVFIDPKYEHKSHIYDSEQVIIRQIDRKLRRVSQTYTDVIVMDKHFSKRSIKNIILHIHTRFDMCPYCLESLRRRFSTWKSLFEGLSFNIIVSSRQEYIPSAMILYDFPTYQGSSMRYIGIDEKSRNSLSEVELAQFNERGLVAQIPLSSWDILGL